MCGVFNVRGVVCCDSHQFIVCMSNYPGGGVGRMVGKKWLWIRHMAHMNRALDPGCL